jgi:hypothetical protein
MNLEHLLNAGEHRVARRLEVEENLDPASHVRGLIGARSEQPSVIHMPRRRVSAHGASNALPSPPYRLERG